MAIRDVLKMGDPRLLEPARPVEDFSSLELAQLIVDMHDTMRALNGAGLAAPQIGVGLQVVIFEVNANPRQVNPRYPDAESVPFTVLINPVLTPLSDVMEEGWKAACRCPACAGWCRATPPYATRLRRGRPADRPQRERFPCPCGTARSRPSARNSLSDAHPRSALFRFHRHPVSGQNLQDD